MENYQDLAMHTIPVQPTDGTCLLMHFYDNEAQITEGRDITEKEYKEGAKVCLVPENLAMRLGKELGGYSDASSLLCRLFPFGRGGVHAGRRRLSAEQYTECKGRNSEIAR